MKGKVPEVIPRRIIFDGTSSKSSSSWDVQENLYEQDAELTDPPSKYERAAIHIITNRTLGGSWFWQTSDVEGDITMLDKLVEKLLKKNEGFLNGIIKREPWSVNSGCSDFKKITELVPDRSGESADWTLVAILLALATKLAQHFYKNGASEDYVRKFAHYVGKCIKERAQHWEQRGDPWEILRQASKTPESSKTYLSLFTAGAFAISFMTLLTHFTQTVPVFINRMK